MSLPSPTFLALFPFQPVPETGRWRPMAVPLKAATELVAEIKAGRWPFDPNEVDPRTGHTVLQSIARNPALDDDVAAAYVGLLAHLPPQDWRARDPRDGLDAVSFLRKEKNWALLKVFEDAGFKSSAGLSATQNELMQGLRSLREGVPYFGVAAFMDKLHAEFGSLDAPVNGLPLGLWPLAAHGQINGPDLVEGRLQIGETKAARNTQMVDKVLESFALVAKAAQAKSPGCTLASWCWLGRAVALCDALRREVGTPRQRGLWFGKFEKDLGAYLGKTFPGQTKPDALVALATRWTQDMATALPVYAAHQPTPTNNRLQAAAALVAAGQSSLHKLLGPVLGPDWADAKQPLETEMWSTLNQLAPLQAGPIAGDVDAAQRWSSAYYYALSPLVQEAARAGAELPSHLPLLPLPLIVCVPPVNGPSKVKSRILEWLAAVPADAPGWDVGRALATAANPAALSALAHIALDNALPSPSSPPSKVRI